MSDDIILVGADQAEHDSRLEKVIQRLDEHGLTLNASKCPNQLARSFLYGPCNH